MARASYRVKEAIRFRNVPSPHEDNWLSWPNRQSIRRTRNDAELEDNNDHRADLEARGQENQTQKAAIGIRMLNARASHEHTATSL